MKPVAILHTNLKGKFGLPRQGTVNPGLRSTVVLEPEYRNPDAFRGLSDFSHIWLIWEFSDVIAKREQAKEPYTFSPTVRPPRLGGNRRLGVFATRSPNRPNPIGISAVKLEEVRLEGPDGPTLVVSGADLMDGTPILDIKPYIPYSDSIPDAAEGFTAGLSDLSLHVEFPKPLLNRVPEENREELLGILSHDPRPQYQRDPSRIYGLSYLNFDVKFRIEGDVLTVVDLI
ncbi:MAG: tRNA (N6-threonylcarbamoyladenosine(37)-N6)-methyltransferase TrmO [Acutalibacteraceae bacterium]